MPRKESEAFPEGNGPILQRKEFGSGQHTMEDVYRMMKDAFDRWDRKLDEILDKMVEEHIEERTSINQRLTRLEHSARLPRLAIEADGHANTKTRERKEGAATAVQAMRGDSFSAHRVEPGPNTNSTSFGVKAEPPALPCRDDVVVKSDDAAPRSCLPSLEMRSPTAAGGLLPTGVASTATRTTFNEPLLQFYATEEMNPEEDLKKENVWTLIPSACYDSSFWKLLAAPYCRRVVETKSRQNRTFDLCGSQDHLRACPFMGTWRTLVCGEALRAGATRKDCSSFLEDRLFETGKSSGEPYEQKKYAVRIAFFEGDSMTL